MVDTVKPDLRRTWAAGAPSANVVDPDVTTPGKFDEGWLAEVPPFEHFNFLQKLFTQGLAHNNEQGINVWDTNTVYPVDALVKGSDGIIYTAAVEQAGNDPVADGGVNWIDSLMTSTRFVDEVSDMKVLKGVVAGRTIVFTKNFSAGNGGSGIYDTIAGTGTANTRDRIAHATLSFTFVLRLTTPLSANQFDLATDATAGIQRALEILPSGPADGNAIYLEKGLNYVTSGSGNVVPPNTELDCNNARVTYTGTGTAFTLGDSDTVLSFAPKVLNINLILDVKTSTGVRLRGTRGAYVQGNIQGFTAVFDNTRTNIGVHIDGVNVSSFFNTIEVKCNHVHEGFRIQSTGTVQATGQLFLNCTVFGDTTLGDDLSIGYNFGGSGGVAGEGGGTVISGGNLEDCNTGFLVGANAGRVTVSGVRTELTASGTAWKFDFVDGCQRWVLIGVTGLGLSYMESNSGIRNWDSEKHTFIGDENGSLRLAGFDAALDNTQFIGIGGVASSIEFDSNADFRIKNGDDATGTGQLSLQPGRGSASFGAHLRLHGAAHATAAGDIHLGPSSASGVLRVKNGIGQVDRMIVTAGAITHGVDNTGDFGSATIRAKQVFAVNGTINTSDARLKTKVKNLSKDELNAGKEILKVIGGWQWLAKVEKEGEDARMHYGPTVQAIMKILEDNNIEPFSLSFVCFDEWDDEYKKVDLNEGEVDKKGKPLKPNIVEELALEGGDRYSLRKSELILFLLAGISARLDAAGI